MKKSEVISICTIVCFCILSLTGCGSKASTSTEADKTSVVDRSLEEQSNSETVTEDDTKSVAKSEVLAQELEESPDHIKVNANGWEVVRSFQFDFSVYKTAFASPDVGMTGGYSGETHTFNSLDSTWPQGENDSACLFGLDIVNENVAYACGNSCNVIKSTDAGLTWSQVSEFGGSSPIQCRMLSFCDEFTGWIAHETRLASTSDGGMTWNEITIPASIMNIRLINATTGYILGMDRKLYITNDNGQTWTTKDIVIDGFENSISLSQSSAISFSEDGSGILFYLEKGGILQIYETQDNADSWTSLATLDISGDISSPYFMYLSKDAKTLTVQTNTGTEAAVITKVD